MIRGLRQKNTCHQVPLLVNFKEKSTFRGLCLHRYLVHGTSPLNDLRIVVDEVQLYVRQDARAVVDLVHRILQGSGYGPALHQQLNIIS
jgi:hypothetical protein